MEITISSLIIVTLSVVISLHILCPSAVVSAVVVDVMLLLIFKLTKHKAPTLGELGAEHESVVSGQGGDTLNEK